ncbi:hypothetical protein ELH53_10685 [Rhizobium ruizarguesonis]|nr:hypothetical protein ELI44_10780 [Rhizobium ruizarguesonis]TAV05764.1 hypothetical protein ELI39_11060 [Rhizobium ruizarguesonis]TAZ95048.1 hypothetical protein ELH67_11115 [Rhizobium ruizarguesonis]TBA80719.1 hypothetical protein ELH56_11025 [Rhizobium ruizarguesonis]TBA85428.1 hypothetical protein ELH53_10685 [Rhizobium ruizarguesonis]
MNTYRAMGVTGYLFKNDSTSPKILFQNFRCVAQENLNKRKPADPRACRRFMSKTGLLSRRDAGRLSRCRRGRSCGRCRGSR